MNSHIQIASFVATILDSRFRAGKFRFGLSALFDLVPGIGDLLNAFLSLYLVWIALEMKLPTSSIVEMLWNIGVSFVISLVPVAGDIGYILYKPNIKNLAIIKNFSKSIVTDGEIY